MIKRADNVALGKCDKAVMCAYDGAAMDSGVSLPGDREWMLTC